MTPTNRTAPDATQGQSTQSNDGSAARPSEHNPSASSVTILAPLLLSIRESLDAQQEALDEILRHLRKMGTSNSHAAVLTSSRFQGSHPATPGTNRDVDHVPAGAPRMVENTYENLRCPVCEGTIFKGEVCAMSRNVNTGKARSFHRSCFDKTFGQVGVA